MSEIKQPSIPETPCQQAHQGLVVNTVKILANIELEIPRGVAGKFLLPTQSPVQSFVRAAGVRIKNRIAFKYRFAQVNNRMMQYPVMKWRGADDTFFLVENGKISVRADADIAGQKPCSQRHQIIVKIRFDCDVTLSS